MRKLSVTILGVVGLLCCVEGVHAQTISGKGIDTSSGAGYGVQVEMKNMEAHLTANSTAISDYATRFDDLEERLNDLADQVANLTDIVQGIQTSGAAGKNGADGESAANAGDAPYCANREIVVHLPAIGDKTSLVNGSVEGAFSATTVRGQIVRNHCAGKPGGGCSKTWSTYTLRFQCLSGNSTLVSASYNPGTKNAGVRDSCTSSDGKSCLNKRGTVMLTVE